MRIPLPALPFVPGSPHQPHTISRESNRYGPGHPNKVTNSVGIMPKLNDCEIGRRLVLVVVQVVFHFDVVARNDIVFAWLEILVDNFRVSKDCKTKCITGDPRVGGCVELELRRRNISRNFHLDVSDSFKFLSSS